MSDLSRLLGDVYGSGPATEDQNEAEPGPDPAETDGADGTATLAATPTMALSPPAERAPDAALDWADETALDRAFASWVPGPSADAPAAERRLMGDQGAGPELTTEEAPDAPPPTAEWLFEGDAPGAEPGTPPSEALGQARAWARSDDDILPVRGRRRRRR
ncbi:MAG: hypothetical protein M3R01_12955 [Actinomycetota bacterium]|nr:hypothetical protein [Actinomycetota bacterium]